MTNKLPNHHETLSLISEMITNPRLTPTLRRLDPILLSKMVEQIGLEDIGPLVALVTTEQLKGIFDHDLWKNRQPGQEETFQTPRFLTWLEVLNRELGPAATAEKILELDSEFVTFALSATLIVLNMDRLTLEFSEASGDRPEKEAIAKVMGATHSYEFGEFLILSKLGEGWDILVRLFAALDEMNHEWLQKMFTRLEFISNEYIDDNGGLFSVLSAADSIASDVSADREQRLEKEGYVAPVSARHFFESISSASIEEIVETKTQDPISQAYFRGLDPEEMASLKSESNKATGKLQAWLRKASILEPEAAPLLPAGEPRIGELGVIGLLRELVKKDPESFTKMLSEAAFLENVLVAGHSPQVKKRMRAAEATELALQTVQAGIEYLANLTGERGEEILSKKTLVKLFRIGWKLKEPQKLEATKI